MKKIIIIILLFFVVFIIGCSDNTIEDNNEEDNEKVKLEYKEYVSMGSLYANVDKWFYYFKSYKDYEDFHLDSITDYNSDYFKTKGIICFEIMENNCDTEHDLDIYTKNLNIIYIDYKLTKQGYEEGIKYCLIVIEMDLDQIDTYNSIVMNRGGINIYNKYKAPIQSVIIKNEFEDGILHGNVGSSYGLTCYAFPMKYENGRIITPDLKWSSSDENVAIVSNMGHVRFLGIGTCKVTASSNGCSDTIEVDVKGDNIQEKYEQYYNLLLSGSMKGIELYCFRNMNNKYECVMLPGTNRFKTVDEIKELQDNSACPISVMKELITYADDTVKQSIFITIISNPATNDELAHETKLYENELEALYVYLGLKEKDDNWILNQFDLSGEKYTFSGNIDMDFTDDCIILTLMNTDTYPILEASDFGIDNIVKVEYIAERPPAYKYDDGTDSQYNQILCIYVKPRGKEKILEYIKELEKLEFVRSANPNMILTID